jgi:hypothetical protein
MKMLSFFFHYRQVVVKHIRKEAFATTTASVQVNSSNGLYADGGGKISSEE